MGAGFSSLGSSDLVAQIETDQTLVGTTNLNFLETNHTSCPIDSPWSCSVPGGDSCCYEGQNGLFLQTQFWDYDPATGPSDLWTLHGLWSDRCQGGYNQFCNTEWSIRDARRELEELGMHELIEKMDTVWKNMGRPDDQLWTHEFNKHGTCMSTVSPKCYPEDSGNQNVGDFFNSAVTLFESLPTYEWLKMDGIVPDNHRTYSVAEFSSSLARYTNGRTVFLGCDRHNNINQVWYFYKLKGSVANGQFEMVDSISTSTCTDGFRYLPKQEDDDVPGFPDYPGGHKPGKGKTRQNLYVQKSKSKKKKKLGKQGCIISDGSWYRGGTCATFQVVPDDKGVHLTSSKGDCGINGGVFQCNNKVDWSSFEVDDDGFLSYEGEDNWSAKDTPRKQHRMPVTIGDNENEEIYLRLA